MLDVEFDKATNVRISFAIEFDPAFVRIMQFRDKEGTNYRLRSFSEVPLKEGDIVDGVIVNVEAVAKAIMKGIDEAKPRKPNSSYVISILPETYTFFLTTEFPEITKEELRGIINRKVDEIFPMPPADIYWDWHRIGTKNNKTIVQLAAIPKKIIDSYLQALNMAKLTPLLFEPSAISAGRLVASVDSKSAEAGILLEVSTTAYVLSLMKDGEISFSTEMNLPTLSPKENIKVLVRRISEIIRYSLGEEYKLENTPILIYGETEYIDTVIEEFVELKIAGAINLNYNIKGDDVGHHLYRKNKEAYIPLIGAAMKGIGTTGAKQNATTINLVPQIAKESFRRNELSRMMRNYLTFIAINVILLIVMVGLASIGISKATQEEKARYQAVINFSQSQKAKEIENSINELNSLSSQTKKLLSGIYDWQKVFTVIRDVTPATITINSLSMAPDPQAKTLDVLDFLISGTAKDRASIITFTDNLRGSKLVTDVKLPLESLESDTNVNFIVEAKLPYSALINNETNSKQQN